MYVRYIHPLVITLIIYIFADLVFSLVLGFSAYQLDNVWSNSYYPSLHLCIVMFSVFAVYFVAYSNVKLGLILHGVLKLVTFVFNLHCVIDPDFYGIMEPEAFSTLLYYLLTLVLEMTAFFVINKMNIPFNLDEESLGYHKDSSEEDDEVMVTCC